MNFINLIIVLTIFFVYITDAARMLFVIPTPSISHQLPFRPLTQELARRGHEVVVITTDPAFPKGKAPTNLTEIDVHDISYAMLPRFIEKATGNKGDIYTHMKVCHEVTTDVFEAQLQSKEVQKTIYDKNNTFDLLLVEECVRPTLVMSHLIKNVPMISISSFGSLYGHYAQLGVPVHPILYPPLLNQWTYNLTFWDKLRQVHTFFWLQYMYITLEKSENKMLRNNLGPDVPSLSELYNNVELYMLNLHPLWGLNRPVPPSVVHIGGIHAMLKMELLEEDLEHFLNSSKNGVIYMSLGTNVKPSLLPEHKIRMFKKVLSEQPYDVLWKYDKDYLEGKPNNMKIGKWFPQSKLLQHPKIKLFITQGGLQSTDEAIMAGVPVIGLPMLADQWYNTNNYMRYRIGIKLDMDNVDEDQFREAVKEITEDESYRKNVIKLRNLMNDEPQRPLERAIWWIEYVIRHGGAKHLRAPAANMSWVEFFEIEVIVYLLVSTFIFIILFVTSLYYLLKLIISSVGSAKVKRS